MAALTSGTPTILVAAFTVPTGGCGPLTTGDRFHLFFADPDADDGNDKGDRFRVVVAPAHSSPAVGKLLREHYLIRKWITVPDRPMHDGDSEADTCYSGNKLLGSPRWSQGDDTPTCPTCKRPMELFLQLDGGDGEMSNLWGDAMLYVFHCPRHPGTWTTLRQYS